MSCKIHVGAQGWNYDDWVGPFYPRGTRPGDYLDVYARAFDTVEIDSTFYAIPAENSITSWHKRAPAGFTYSLKLPQEITHVNRLRQSEDALARFCERVRPLNEKLALILIQLPPDFSPRSLAAVEKFLPLLQPDLRFAIEFRDPNWLSDETGEYVLDLLAAHRVALTLTDGKWVKREQMFRVVDRPTADFAYVRWMGPRELTVFSHVQINRDRELAAWAGAFQVLRQHVGQVFGYFNNHFQGHSPASCNQFKRLIGQPVVEPDELNAQPSLF
jgi:uncharacterized protein YecE (DUF72 family)